MSDPINDPPLTTPREYKDNPFEKQYIPKNPVQLDPPKDDIIPLEELAASDGKTPDKRILVAIKGIVFDVSKNKAYQQGGAYHVFAGKDPSRALAKSSLKAEDCQPEWHDLNGEEQTVLADWFKFFEKRYNIVGRVQNANNMEH